MKQNKSYWDSLMENLAFDFIESKYQFAYIDSRLLHNVKLYEKINFVRIHFDCHVRDIDSHVFKIIGYVDVDTHAKITGYEIKEERK